MSSLPPFLIQYAFIALCCCFLVTALPAAQNKEDNANTETEKKYLIVEELPKCENNENLGECLKRAMNLMWPRFKDGKPEYNIQPYEPFVMNRTTYQYTNGPISGRITAKRTEIHGFSSHTVKNVEAKFSKDKFKMRIHALIPKMHMNGTYKADMTFNAVHVKPKGTFNVTLLDVDVTTRLEGDIFEKDGHKFMHIKNLESNPKIGDLQIKANGIFPDPTLDEVVLGIANEYWRDVYSIMLPETRQYWQPMIINNINEVFKQIPIDAYINIE